MIAIVVLWADDPLPWTYIGNQVLCTCLLLLNLVLIRRTWGRWRRVQAGSTSIASPYE